MAKKTGQAQTPLEADVNAVLEQRVADFRQRLGVEAENMYLGSGRGGGIRGEDVEAAYRRLVVPDKRPRTGAQKTVSAAFKENRFIQLAGYGMALSLFGFGLFLLGYGVFGPTDAVGRIAGLVGGSFSQILLLIPLRFAVNARRHNEAIRLLGYLLDNVDDPKLLADLIQRLIGEVASGRQPADGTGTRSTP